MKNLSIFFKIAAVLWIIWGFVHVFAGGITIAGVMTNDTAASFSGIADGMNPTSFRIDYPAGVGAVLAQHGFNLLWAGLVTFFAAFWVWKGNKTAIFLAALVGGLIDLGYFIFMDLGGYVNFAPGTVMTIICAIAIVLSFFAYFKNRQIS